MSFQMPGVHQVPITVSESKLTRARHHETSEPCDQMEYSNVSKKLVQVFYKGQSTRMVSESG